MARWIAGASSFRESFLVAPCDVTKIVRPLARSGQRSVVVMPASYGRSGRARGWTHPVAVGAAPDATGAPALGRVAAEAAGMATVKIIRTMAPTRASRAGPRRRPEMGVDRSAVRLPPVVPICPLPSFEGR